MSIFVCENNFDKYKSVLSVLKAGVYEENDSYDISICIPAFKRGELLRQALMSCINQNANNLHVQIIVVDNNTEDGNENYDVVMDINTKYNVNVLYYQNAENIGMFGNWNRCIELASAAWVSILHDDDLLMNDCFVKWEQLLGEVKKQSVGYIKASYKKFTDKVPDEKKTHEINGIDYLYLKKNDYRFATSIGRFGMPTAGVLMNRQAVISCGGYNESLYPSDDAFFPFRLMDKGYEVIYTITPFGYYRYAVNESFKYETQVGWIDRFVELIDAQKKMDDNIGAFAKKFEKIQMWIFVNEYIMGLVKSDTDRKRINEYVVNRNLNVDFLFFKYILYKVEQKVHYMLFNFRVVKKR